MCCLFVVHMCVCVCGRASLPSAILLPWLRFHFIRILLIIIWSVSTIGGGSDTTIPSPGMAPKQPLPGIALHDPLHGRQTCPKFTSFHQGVRQISPPEGGAIFVSSPPKTGTNLLHPRPPPPIVERLFACMPQSSGHYE